MCDRKIFKLPHCVVVEHSCRCSLSFNSRYYCMTIHAREIILIGAAFAEDLVLAEERTTEKDRKRIMEGKLIGLWQHCAAVAFCWGWLARSSWFGLQRPKTRCIRHTVIGDKHGKHVKNRPCKNCKISIRNTVNISFWFSSCCGGWPLFFTLGPQWLLAALFATMPHKKRWTYTQPSKSLKRFFFSPPLFSQPEGRQSRANAKSRRKRRNWPVMSSFLSFLLSGGSRPSFFYGLRILIM